MRPSIWTALAAELCAERIDRPSSTTGRAVVEKMSGVSATSPIAAGGHCRADRLDDR
jgi:hypothetical protein